MLPFTTGALNLGMREDLGLAVAGLVGTALLLAQRTAARAAHGRA